MNTIHPAKFRKHVQYIAKINQSQDRRKHISIAFDDGYESVYTNAFPIMEEYNLKGIVFPISGYIGKTNDWDITFGVNRTMHLTESQLKTLSKHGWEIGSHSHLHRSFRWIKSEEIKDEVVTSKRIIESIIGKKITSFCLPFGDYTIKAVEIIENAKYINLFMQLPLLKRVPTISNIQFQYYRSIYSTDSVKSLENKYQKINREHLKESFIHSFSTATVLVKEML
ncbi:MAG: polysaccharide deacetylase family protein [Candidatus Marinimicrobia bacterium]|nr:polysaccharide deacetylase family protein [Candidatus Neomarinimicrobiota bacterium]